MSVQSVDEFSRNALAFGLITRLAFPSRADVVAVADAIEAATNALAASSEPLQPRLVARRALGKTTVPPTDAAASFLPVWVVHGDRAGLPRPVVPAQGDFPMRTSPGLGRRALISSLSFAVAVVVGVPTAASAKTLGQPVNYPLRHSFSMAVGLPGAGRHEPTDCYEIPGGPDYVCRIVAGVEETGDNRNFFPSADAVLEKGNDPTYGTTLVDKDGTQYEGCDPIDEWSWECDYASRMHVSRHHYDSSGYVLRVLWRWQKYVGGQAGCAASLAALWTRVGPAAFLGVLRACQNGPMERP